MSLHTPYDMSPKTGDFLISSPKILDPRFMQSVIFLCSHDNTGSFGLNLNQPTEMIVSDLIPGFDCRLTVYEGGPVEPNSLHLLHHSKDNIYGGLEIIDDIYLGGDLDEIVNGIKKGNLKQASCRFFIGYSGWNEDQLVQELIEESWLVQPADAKKVFNRKSKNIWREVLTEMGDQFKLVSTFPIDPRFN
ncbi:MAG: YqgE/AlgH family protein [Lentisphaeria bacterium]|nr:YqgE/AlgH family protein [Lentisphaeria bacterium]